MSKHGTRHHQSYKAGSGGQGSGDLPQGVTFDKSSPRPGIPSSRIFCGSRCMTNVSGTDAPWDFPGPPTPPRRAEQSGPQGRRGRGVGPPCPEPGASAPLATAVDGAGAWRGRGLAPGELRLFVPGGVGLGRWLRAGAVEVSQDVTLREKRSPTVSVVANRG